MSNILKQHAIKHYGGLEANLPARLPYGDTYLTSDTGKFFKYNLDGIPQEITTGSIGEVEDEIRTNIQGYYGLLSPFYFGGVATDLEIGEDNVDEWTDVEMVIDAQGLFDNRVKDMKDVNAVGHEGDGSNGSPITLELEGLTTTAFANFRASLSFTPDEDEGQVETRLLFNRHSGTSPSEDFSIEEVSISMQSGADIEYTSEPMLSFFVGDTIDTNGVGDAGKCRFQIKSSVEGTLSMRALTWYLHK